MEAKLCGQCSKKFYGRGLKYCSRTCSSASRTGIPLSPAALEVMIATRWGGGRQVKKACFVCEKQLLLQTHRLLKQNYCSLKCANKGKIGVHANSDTEFKRGQSSPKGMLGKQHSEETKLKMSGRKGELSARWIKDRTKLKTDRVHMYDTRYKYWMQAVKNRDGWKCRLSNGSCSGRLEAHHIMGWKEHPRARYQLNNGITLCLAHHPRKRVEEKRLAPTFVELVSVSKV